MLTKSDSMLQMLRDMLFERDDIDASKPQCGPTMYQFGPKGDLSLYQKSTQLILRNVLMPSNSPSVNEKLTELLGEYLLSDKNKFHDKSALLPLMFKVCGKEI